jgi:hypothetical protein
MTEEEKRIVEAIWGQDAGDHSEEELLAVVNGISAMAEVMRSKIETGKVVQFIESEQVH